MKFTNSKNLSENNLKKSNNELENLKNRIIFGYIHNSLDNEVNEKYLSYFDNRGMDYKKVYTEEIYYPVLKEILKNNTELEKEDIDNIIEQTIKYSSFKNLNKLYEKGLIKIIDKDKILKYLISASYSSYAVSSKEERLDKMNLVLNNSNEKVIANSYLFRYIMQEFGTDTLKDFMKNDKFYIDSFSSIGLPKEIDTELCELIFEKGGNTELAIQFNQENKVLLDYLKSKGYDTTSKYKKKDDENSILSAKIRKRKEKLDNQKNENENNLEM